MRKTHPETIPMTTERRLLALFEKRGRVQFMSVVRREADIRQCAHHQRRSASSSPCRRSGGWLGSESTCRLRYSRAALFVFGDEANASFTALDSLEIVQNSASSAQCFARSRCSATRRGTGNGTLVGISASGAPAG